MDPTDAKTTSLTVLPLTSYRLVTIWFREDYRATVRVVRASQYRSCLGNQLRRRRECHVFSSKRGANQSLRVFFPVIVCDVAIFLARSHGSDKLARKAIEFVCYTIRGMHVTCALVAWPRSAYFCESSRVLAKIAPVSRNISILLKKNFIMQEKVTELKYNE